MKTMTSSRFDMTAVEEGSQVWKPALQITSGFRAGTSGAVYRQQSHYWLSVQPDVLFHVKFIIVCKLFSCSVLDCYLLFSKVMDSDTLGSVFLPFILTQLHTDSACSYFFIYIFPFHINRVWNVCFSHRLSFAASTCNLEFYCATYFSYVHVRGLKLETGNFHSFTFWHLSAVRDTVYMCVWP